MRFVEQQHNRLSPLRSLPETVQEGVELLPVFPFSRAVQLQVFADEAHQLPVGEAGVSEEQTPDRGIGLAGGQDVP